MTTLQQKYRTSVAPVLQKEFKIGNIFAIPKITKVVINTGITDPQDPRARKAVVENVREQFKQLSGQQPVITLAKKSISGFKLRAGDPMGVKVTLRGEKMWFFLIKLLDIALPRVKDFRGVSRTAFDEQGNYSLGIDEQIIFPEIEYDKIDSIRPLQVVICTTAPSADQARRLLELMGMPFSKETTK
ncbi:50S ribosomal protein L5 [Candidatus Woesebacteria bacterium]|nr:50S ribosomal protein L5 [Candidatus Woesebacteria bacterium]